MAFKGLLKVKNKRNHQVKHNPVYMITVEKLESFVPNNETSAILLWDLKEKIGLMDEVDRKALNCLK